MTLLSDLLSQTYSGYSGTSGYSGYSGTSGYSGLTGYSGYSGYSGQIGSQGESGISGYSGYSGYSGSGVVSWVKKTENYTAVIGDKIIADTTTSAFTITLPSTPSLGNSVTIADGNNWTSNNLTIARNGSTIEGLSEDFTLDIKGIVVDFLYDGTTWEIFSLGGSNVAARGGNGDQIFFENGTTITSNYTITTNMNAMSAGPITIDSDVAITIPTGSVWTIV